MDLLEWAPPDRLADWVHDASDRLLASVSDFADDDERWIGPYLPIVNPPIWEIAHVAWFAEWFVLRRLHGRAPLLADVDARYDSAAVPHITRWKLTYPDAATTRAYVRAVAEGLADVVLDDRGLDSTAHYVLYSIVHFDAHVEALTYTRQTLDWGPHPTLPVADWPVGPSVDAESGVAAITGDKAVDGATMLLGASREQPFVLDNERWAHHIEVPSFSMATTPVTVAEYRAFVDDGGYDDERLWSAEGWAWRRQHGIDGPAYWRRGGDGWQRRICHLWQPIETTADHPMVHVSWWEADAYCRWAGRRLPTEPEWELAATRAPDGSRQPWFPWGDRDPQPGEARIDLESFGTAPVGAYPAGDGPWGHRQLIGNVWEWTSSTFEPYPHFEPDAYRDNSEPWFGSRKVLRGGAWASRSRSVRSTYRNYFEPHRRDVLAGFRTCPR